MLGRVIISFVACLSFLVGLSEQVEANQGNSQGKQTSVPDEVPKKENLNKGNNEELSPSGQKPQNNSSEVVGEKGVKKESSQTTRAPDRSKEVKSKEHRETKTNKNTDRSMKKGNQQTSKNREMKKNDSKGKSSRPPISSPQKHKKPEPEKSVLTKKTKEANEKKHQEEHRKAVVDSSDLGKVKDKSTSPKENEKALHNRNIADERNRSVKNILLDLPPPVDDPTGRKPLQEEGVLQASSLSLQGKTGKDRSQGDSIYQWLLGDLYLYVSESAENHAEIVLRHHRLRTQWMNAPPGEPPKRASLFL